MIFMRFSVSGQTCGQTENLRTFKTSGEPKKSVFVGVLGVFQNFRFEIGGLHQKPARIPVHSHSRTAPLGKLGSITPCSVDFTSQKQLSTVFVSFTTFATPRKIKILILNDFLSLCAFLLCADFEHIPTHASVL
jgi:hypothetical protein